MLGIRGAGPASRRQPEGGDPGVREEPSLDSTRLCLLRGDETGLDGSDGAKRGAGEDGISGRIPAGVVQLCRGGILASAILAMAADGAAPDELETLLRTVPSPRDKHTVVQEGLFQHLDHPAGIGAFQRGDGHHRPGEVIDGY